MIYLHRKKNVESMKVILVIGGLQLSKRRKVPFISVSSRTSRRDTNSVTTWHKSSRANVESVCGFLWLKTINEFDTSVNPGRRGALM